MTHKTFLVGDSLHHLPMASFSSIAAKLDNDAYDPELISQLEAYVREQVAGATYDARANKALLKLYHFFPERTDEAVLAALLAKALMALPSGDFATLLFLVPDVVQARPLNE